MPSTDRTSCASIGSYIRIRMDTGGYPQNFAYNGIQIRKSHKRIIIEVAML